MLRELQTITGKNYDVMNVAGVAMVAGMAVVKDYTKNEVKFATPATDKGVYFVTKEKVQRGNYAEMELSDYEDQFMNIKKGEFVKLVTPIKGERYATDQCADSGISVGNFVSAGTDGKFAKSESATRFVYRGTKKVDNHTLHVIEVVD